MDCDDSAGVVAQRDTEFPVEIGPIGRGCVSQSGDDVAQLRGESADLVRGQLPTRSLLAELRFKSAALARRLADPRSREGGIDVVVEELVVLRDSTVAVGDLRLESLISIDDGGVGFADACERTAGLVDVHWLEELGEPLVEARSDGGFPHVDAAVTAAAWERMNSTHVGPVRWSRVDAGLAQDVPHARRGDGVAEPAEFAVDTPVSQVGFSVARRRTS